MHHTRAESVQYKCHYNEMEGYSFCIVNGDNKEDDWGARISKTFESERPDDGFHSIDRME